MLNGIRLLAALCIYAAGTSAQAFSITDVTFQIPPDAPQFADAAELLPGNDNVAGVNSLGGDFAGDPWTLLDKTDDSSTEYMGVTFVLEADANATSGNWSLSWSETGAPGLPLTMDFVFVTKAANDWGAYLFESITFTTDPMTGNGTFEITWTNNGGQIPGLSHASIYGRGAEIVVEVPAPSSLLLLGLGVFALRRFMKRLPARRSFAQTF
ncbi:MAG: PEP-CTERM sorting domain-containing protein [Halioglobus sp.]|nr:PEP-CTERM sorting domain-containing protein [Halioglobus sp.]